jgi:hypothetical protein
VLLFLAGLDVVIAWSLFFPADPLPASTGYARSIMDLWAWATLWSMVAAVCGLCAFRHDDRAGFAGAMLIKVLWASMYLGGAVTGHIPRGLVSAAVWAAFAGFVWLISSWPEPHCPYTVGEALRDTEPEA